MSHAWMHRASEDVARRLGRYRATAGDFGVYAASSVVLNVATLVASVLALRWIRPEAMGVWQTLVVAQSYLGIVRLGIPNGLNRELPYLLGQGQKAAAYEAAASAQGYAIGCSAAGFAAFAAALAVLWGRGWEWRAGLAASAVMVAANFYLAYVLATFRSQTEFRRLGYVQLAQAVLTLGMPLLAYLWGFLGYCAGAAGQAVAVTVVAFWIRPLRVRPRLDGGALRLLWATGLPLFATSYAYTLATGFDRIILLQRAGTEAVGYYAPSRAILAAMAVVPTAISTYVYPRMSFRLGATQDGGRLRSTSLSAMGASFVAGVPIALAGWLLMPLLVEAVFPQYLPGLRAMRISLLTGLALCATPGTAVLASLKSWRLLALYVGVYVAAMGGFPLLLSRSGDPLAGVALGCLAAAAVIGGTAVLVSLRATRARHAAAGIER